MLEAVFSHFLIEDLCKIVELIEEQYPNLDSDISMLNSQMKEVLLSTKTSKT